MQAQGPSETITPRPARGDEQLVEATETGLTGLALRHPSVRHFGPLFAYGQLPVHLRTVSKSVAELAAVACNLLADGPELAAGLRKLREAKDCLVTQAVIDSHTE
jgi:hypothetical protein